MNSRIRNRLYGTFFRNPEEPTPAPGASDVIEEEELGSERLLALSARLRKKERELEDLRIELAEWERLLSAREDYLRTCEGKTSPVPADSPWNSGKQRSPGGCAKSKNASCWRSNSLRK